MNNLRFQGALGLNDSKYHISLLLVEFAEDNVTIIYSPALDLSGYGNSEDEAKESFNIALHEFLRYTSNKNTFNDVLIELGWEIKGSKKNPKFKPPLNSDLAQNNPLYNGIINGKNHKVFSQDIEFAF
jgi:hypothetical protein